MVVKAGVLAVAVELPQHAGLSSLLQYASERALASGTLVRVPLGRRDVPGIVWDADGAPAVADLKPVRQALPALPPLAPDGPGDSLHAASSNSRSRTTFFTWLGL